MCRSRSGLQKCVCCNGKGYIQYREVSDKQDITTYNECNVCLGYGYVSEEDIKEIQQDMSRCISYMDL